jgi:hypothetical protein
MPPAVFEPTIPAFERTKTVHALDRAVTVIGLFVPLLSYIRQSDHERTRPVSAHNEHNLGITVARKMFHKTVSLSICCPCAPTIDLFNRYLTYRHIHQNGRVTWTHQKTATNRLTTKVVHKGLPTLFFSAINKDRKVQFWWLEI